MSAKGMMTCLDCGGNYHQQFCDYESGEYRCIGCGGKMKARNPKAVTKKMLREAANIEKPWSDMPCHVCRSDGSKRDACPPNCDARLTPTPTYCPDGFCEASEPKRCNACMASYDAAYDAVLNGEAGL